jgi:PAS domain S-box-containing protein
MQHLEDLSWNQLVNELRELADHKPSPDGARDDPNAVLHNLFVHQVELEMQNRELRDAQQRLEASRTRYADLYDFAPVGCLTIGADERIREINLTGAALLGRDRADIIGRPFIGVVPLREKAMVFHEHVRRCIEARCRVDDEIEFLPKGRPPMLLHVTSAPLLDDDGNAIACRTALTDVTDRRRADNAEADARMKEQFLGTVSHELRTPLTAILGWVNLLQTRDRRAGDYDAGEVRRGLEVIERNASLQTQLIDDLLDVSRILAGKLRVDVQPLDLEPLIRQSVESLRPASEARGIALSVSIEPESIVQGDADRLTQVLTNLLNNSLKFTPRRGSIEVFVTTEADWVRIVVRDTGRGIAPQDLTRVFERFQQIDGSTTRTAGGLGLGLAIVDHIVRAHGGDVVATSAGLGLGAAFTVRLRRARAVARDVPSAPGDARTIDEPSLEGCKILCVDDDLDALEVICLALQQRGAIVTKARTAAEALEAIVSSTPDVMVSDIGLPGEDGCALMHQIRALPGAAGQVPAVALTGYAGAFTAGRALEAGFRQFLCKPVAPALLVRVVAGVVGRQAGTHSAS